MVSKKTGGREYGVFIIESIDYENEQAENLDGYSLHSMLSLCGIESRYHFIRTKKELKFLMKEFDKSNYAFLHLACHGNEEELSLALDDIPFSELGKIIGESMYRRRLFLSACMASRFELAEQLIPRFHCLSVIGTPNEIHIDQAAVFWSTFYYLMYQDDTVSMPQKLLMPTIVKMTNMFGMKLNYFSIIRNSNPRSINHLRQILFDRGKTTYDKVNKTGFRNQFRTS